MNTKTAALAAVIIILVACIGAGAWYYSSDNDAESQDTEITVTDMQGREVTVSTDIDRIVCLSAGSLRLVCYMGAYNKVVGIDNYDALISGYSSNYYMATYRIAYDDIQSITCVGDETNYKDIMATNAQLIISSSTDIDELNELQTNTGIPVIAVSASGNIDVDDEEFEQNINLLGTVLGLEERAAELLSGIDELLEKLETYKTSSTVSADCYIGGMFYMMSGGLLRTTGNYASFDWTVAENVMPDINNGNPYDTDSKALAESGAEYIFVDCMTYSSSKTTFEEIKSAIQDIDAVKNGNIYSTLVYKYYGTNWESELMNAFYIGSILDPDVYDYDIADICDEILSLFYPGSDITYEDVIYYQLPGFSQLDW